MALAHADDISASARGVVRMVTAAVVDDEVVGFGHGSGFAVGPNRVVIGAHVAEARRDADAPPHGRHAAIIVSSEDRAAAEETARMIGRTAPEMGEDMHVYGPAPAPLAMLRHRHRLLVPARRSFDVQQVLRDWPGGPAWGPKPRCAWRWTSIPTASSDPVLYALAHGRR